MAQLHFAYLPHATTFRPEALTRNKPLLMQAVLHTLMADLLRSKNEHLRMGRDILNRGHLRGGQGGPEMSFAFVEENRDAWPFEVQCAALGVSRSVFPGAPVRKVPGPPPMPHCAASCAAPMPQAAAPTIRRALRCRAICALRLIERVQVYSPSAAHRKAFVERMRGEKFEVVAVDDPRNVVRGADIVAARRMPSSRARRRRSGARQMVVTICTPM